jgi:guanylate kinase
MYNFISEKEFQEDIKKNEFLEYEKVHDLNYYGTKYRDAITEGIEV